MPFLPCLGPNLGEVWGRSSLSVSTQPSELRLSSCLPVRFLLSTQQSTPRTPVLCLSFFILNFVLVNIVWFLSSDWTLTNVIFIKSPKTKVITSSFLQLRHQRHRETHVCSDLLRQLKRLPFVHPLIFQWLEVPWFPSAVSTQSGQLHNSLGSS